MTIAVRTTTYLTATITQQSLVAAIQTAMLDAGLGNPIGNYENGADRILIYEHVNDASKIYGKLYLQIKITSALQISQQLYSSWNAGNNTGNGGGLETNFTALSSSISITLSAFNASPELKIVVLISSGIVIPLGILAPQIKPSWWDLDLWSWGFYSASIFFSSLRGTNLNPYNNNSFSLLLAGGAPLISANPQTGKRDIVTGLLLTNASNTGIAGKCSDDIAVVAASGLSRFDTLSPLESDQEYMIISNSSGGFAVRIL